MERLNQVTRLPDAVNCSQSKKFTQIPNDLLRNPEISGKAKAILCLLLSNKEGWTSYLITISGMMKEGMDAINSGIQELEQHGYLIRFRYRDKQTKKWKGSFWAYTDFPYSFCIQKNIDQLSSNGLEIYIEKEILENPDVAFPDVAFPDVENPRLIILKEKNTKKKKEKIKSSSSSGEDKITPKLFDRFWRIYPKKTDKGKAFTKWNDICTQDSWKNKRPTWEVVKRAILAQKKSERWQEREFIPLPTTWLNQCRWLDDPKEMISYNGRNNEEDISQSTPNEILESHFNVDWLLRAMKANYEEASKLVGGNKSELTHELCNLHDWIKENQNLDVLEKVNDNVNPSGLIKQYISWLESQNWVHEITVQTFNPRNNLFRKMFLNEKNKELNTNVLTGEFIPSYE